jgi:hypothetical protein
MQTWQAQAYMQPFCNANENYTKPKDTAEN